MDKCGVISSFSNNQSEDLIKLTKEKESTAIITIHLYKTKTVMVQGHPLFIDEWIDKEYPLLCKLTAGAELDNLKWNNSWFLTVDTSIKEGSDMQSRETDQREPILSPEKRDQIMEKARSVKHKRDQQLEDILKVVENLEMKHIDLMKENYSLKETVNNQNNRISTLETELNKLKDQIPKDQPKNLNKRISDIENKLKPAQAPTITLKGDQNPSCEITADLLIMKEDIEKRKNEILKLKRELEDKVQKVTSQTDNYITKQIDNLKALITEEFKEHSYFIDKKIKDHLSATDTMITEKVDEAMWLDWEENSIEDQDDSTDQFHHKESLPDHINLSINKDENDKEETTFVQLYPDTVNRQFLKATSTPNDNIIYESVEHLIIGDSLVQRIKETLFHKNATTKVVSLRGKGIKEVYEFLDKVIFTEGKPKNIIIHIGSNDLTKVKSVEEGKSLEIKYEELISMVKKKFDSSKIIISMVINRFNEEFNRKAQTFNTAIKAICKNLKVLYLFHNNINRNQDLFRNDNIHLSEKGTSALVMNFKQLLRPNKDGQKPHQTRKANDNMKQLFKNMMESFMKMM